MQVAYAVVLDAEVATFCNLFLAHLHINPLGCTLRGNAVALYDALYAYLTWCCNANDAVERYAPVEPLSKSMALSSHCCPEVAKSVATAG